MDFVYQVYILVSVISAYYRTALTTQPSFVGHSFWMLLLSYLQGPGRIVFCCIRGYKKKRELKILLPSRNATVLIQSTVSHFLRMSFDT